jgi:threonine dehydrogenase-like Zn-dependent dehydrogenase
MMVSTRNPTDSRSAEFDPVAKTGTFSCPEAIPPGDIIVRVTATAICGSDLPKP